MKSNNYEIHYTIIYRCTEHTFMVSIYAEQKRFYFRREQIHSKINVLHTHRTLMQQITLL